jgi:hypothetical protein
MLLRHETKPALKTDSGLLTESAAAAMLQNLEVCKSADRILQIRLGSFRRLLNVCRT